MTAIKVKPSGKIYNEHLPTHKLIPWWVTGVVYQVYPRSFQDSNGDGIGDLRGIQQRLPYLRELGIDAIWISPFFKSPMADFGYDVSDYRDIDPIFGTMDDFDAMLKTANDLNIRIIVDFVPNHSSNEHPWFLESRSSHDNPKRDWYIWRDPKPDGSPPNNLVGFFGGSVWTFDEQTGQYYLHMFLEEQPDLNWRNPEVVTAMNDVLHFWLQKGVAGFRLDAITILIKQEPLHDLPEDALTATGLDLLLRLNQMHNQPELHDILRDFRTILDSYDGERILIAETNAGSFEELVGFYGENLDGIQLPMNLRTLNLEWDAKLVAESITEYFASLPHGATPNFVFGNHDQPRLVNRFGEANHRSANMLLLTLWGAPTMYYGDELGMSDGHILPEQRQDPFVGEAGNVGSGRDPERTPMQWDSSPNAGFTDEDVTPWLPINTTFQSNVAEQEANPQSTLNFCKQLLEIRHESDALRFGSIQFMDSPADDLLIYERKIDEEHLLVIINFEGNSHTLDLSALTDNAIVLLSSKMDNPENSDSANFAIRPHESLLLKL